ncbi:MAG TPA: hypothetical protein GX507_06680 [Clostridia bacterium]|nr:hypothetical protein [Clostridia bacterium]
MDRTVRIRELTVKPGEKTNSWVKIGELADGSPLRVPLIIVNGKEPGPRIVVVACAHGDEVIGTEAIKTIARELTPDKIKGTFIGIPILNAVAFLTGTRVDVLETPMGWNDMSKMYSTAKPDGSVTERAASFLRDEVIPQVEYYIDLHSSAVGSLNGPRAIVAGLYAKVDPVVRRRMEELAIGCGFDVIYRPESESYEGMYFRPIPFFEERGTAKIVLETGAAPTLADLDTLRNGIMGCLVEIGMVEGKPKKSRDITYCGRLSAVRANRGGIFRPYVEIGKTVKAGDKIGEITDVFDNIVEEVVSPASGIVVKVATSAIAYTGIRLAVLAIPDNSRL